MAVADQLNEPLPALSTAKFCGGVAPPPWTAVNRSPFCESANCCGRGATLRVTGIFALSPVALLDTARFAVMVPAARLRGSIVAVMFTGAPGAAVPDCAERVIAAAPAPEEVRRKSRLPPPLLSTRKDRVCAAPPAVSETANDPGSIASFGGTAVPTMKVTAMVANGLAAP